MRANPVPEEHALVNGFNDQMLKLFDPRPGIRRTTDVPKTKKLQGKVAVVTGGTSGIGLAAAKLFVKEGAYVFITGRRQKELDEAVQRAMGSNVTGIQGDVAKLADLDRLYEAVKSKGRIDVVFRQRRAWRLNLLRWERSRRSISTASSTSM